MRKRSVWMFLVAVGLLAGIANAGEPLMVKPWVFDPDNTGISESRWLTKIGLPDSGKANHGLLLTKMGPTMTVAAAGAEVTFEGTLTELGFDFDNEGWCGAGAPRFNVYTDVGTFFFGCAHGVHTPAPSDPANWTRVRFGNADAFPAVAGTPFPGFGVVQVTGIDIVFDEGTELPGNPGFAVLDNIDVNGTLVGKPGAAK